MTDLMLAPDVYHGNIPPGQHFNWPPILANPDIRGAWCKATQGDNFTDGECAYNLDAFKAAADRGDIDWFGAYIWPSTRGSQGQVDLYLKTVAKHSDDPRFRWVIDVEGGTPGIMNLIAAGLTKALGKERGGIYGGSHLIDAFKDPTPAQCPAAAALPTFFRPAYIGDPPGQGGNRIPRLFADKVTFWQYTNGVSGPSDQTRFPRSVPGRGHGDFSCFWQPTAKQTYAQWLEATTPGAQGGDGFMAALSDEQQQEVYYRALEDGCERAGRKIRLGTEKEATVRLANGSTLVVKADTAVGAFKGDSGLYNAFKLGLTGA